MQSKNHSYEKYLLPSVVSLLVLALALGGYFYNKSNKVSEDLRVTKIDLTNTKIDLTQSQEKVEILTAELETERYKNSIFAGKISEIVGTVGALDKLARTDKELLQKYSKIYFLNEHYVPDELTNIPPDYIFEQDREMKIHTQVFPYLQNLITDANKAGINLKIISAYRSFGEQSSLKNSYSVTYGSGANKFSADQGYSEHQLGTTVDFTTSKLGANFTAFAKSESFKWLQENAYRYGFILSYPDGNTYYQFEPWHWRFVGRDLANMIHEENTNFYDLVQSKIDSYLIKLFD